MEFLKCMAVTKSGGVSEKWVPSSAIRFVEESPFHDPRDGKVYAFALRVWTSEETWSFYVLRDELVIKNLEEFKKNKVKLKEKGDITAAQVRKLVESRAN